MNSATTLRVGYGLGSRDSGQSASRNPVGVSGLGSWARNEAHPRRAEVPAFKTFSSSIASDRKPYLSGPRLETRDRRPRGVIRAPVIRI